MKEKNLKNNLAERFHKYISKHHPNTHLEKIVDFIIDYSDEVNKEIKEAIQKLILSVEKLGVDEDKLEEIYNEDFKIDVIIEGGIATCSSPLVNIIDKDKTDK